MNKNSSKKVSADEHEKTMKKRKKGKKPKSKGMQIFTKVMSTIGKALATLFLVGVITGCIVVTALTVYVMKFSDTDDIIDIRSYKLNYSTTVYANNAEGVPVEIDKLFEKNREWIDIGDIPQHVIDAFRCTEDIRFYEHDGVDWKRTFASFANLFLHFYDTRQGGSTITQQVIKNITGDDNPDIQRKVREIFRAINMERKFTKDEIMECYLNIIPLGNGTYGIQTAAEFYFGKEVKDLTIAEAASLAATTKSPNTRNIIKNPELNKTRRNNYTIAEMKKDAEKQWKNGNMSEEEYQQRIKDCEAAETEEIKVTGTTLPNTQVNKIKSYFIDEVVREVIADLMEEYGYDYNRAKNMVYNSGLKIYTTMDPGIQKTLEEKYLNPLTFFSKKNVKDPPQSAMVIVDYEGNMKAVVGGRGEKAGNLVLNRATQSKLGIGSSIKPLSTYALALEKNLITYSTVMEDKPTLKRTGKNGKTEMWPSNYDKKKYGFTTIEKAVRVSMNTIPTRIIQELLTPKASFEFMVNKLGITTLVKSRSINDAVESDIDIARLSMGSLVDGMKLSELANAYQIFGNGGYYNELKTYSKVTYANGTVLLEHKSSPSRAISEETASVMNKLLQRVVEGPSGTGRHAKLSSHTVIGKTGTANDGRSMAFVGMTPYYIGAIWVGYDTPKEFGYDVVYRPPAIWKNIMEGIHKKLPKKEFTYSPEMRELKFCSKTGLLAADGCPKETGYYKPDNIPAICSGNH